MYKRVSKKKCRIASERARRLLSDVQKELRNKYRFQPRLVGSGKWGTMIEDSNGHYDLDFQILLTHNSPVYKNSKSFRSPIEIKRDFYAAFNRHKNGKEKFEDSTTAITLINEDGKKYSVDFVIIDDTKEHTSHIIRRNIKRETQSEAEYTWNKLRKPHDAYTRFNALSTNEKRHVIEEKVIPAKVREKSKNDGDPTKRSSSEVFIEEVMNYGK
jgi:hypothetical protein